MHSQAALAGTQENHNFTRTSAGRLLWFILHNVARGLGPQEGDFKFCKETQSGSGSQRSSSHRPSGSTSYPAGCDTDSGSTTQGHEARQSSKGRKIKDSVRLRESRQSAAAGPLISAWRVLLGAATIVIRTDAEFLLRGKVLMVLEGKGSDTLGLVLETVPGKKIVLDGEDGPGMWRRAVEEALGAFSSTTAENSAVYGALMQTINNMILRGADEGVLHDLQTFVFITLRRVSSKNGEDPESDIVNEPICIDHDLRFKVTFHVKRSTDANPTVQQVIACKLRSAAQKQPKWAAVRRHMLRTVGENAKIDQDANTIPDPKLSSWPPFNFDPQSLGDQVGFGRWSTVWEYRECTVLKLAVEHAAVQSLVNEWEVYKKANRVEALQSYVLQLQDFGYAGQVHVLCLPRVESSKCMTAEELPGAKSEVEKAFKALWKAGIAHGDVHAGNLHVERGDAGFKVTILDFGSSCLKVKNEELFQLRKKEDEKCLSALLDPVP